MKIGTQKKHLRLTMNGQLKAALMATAFISSLSSTMAMAEKDTQTEVKEEIITHKEQVKTHIGQIETNRTTLPAKGSTEQQVESQFGNPAKKRDPMGNPPISSWVYPDFTVYFESGYVIHSVAFPANASRGPAKGEKQ